MPMQKVMNLSKQPCLSTTTLGTLRNQWKQLGTCLLYWWGDSERKNVFLLQVLWTLYLRDFKSILKSKAGLP